MDTRFTAPGPLPAIGSATRLKGWQATPLADGPAFGVRLVDIPEAASPAVLRHARLGFGAGSSSIPAGAMALLAQEVRNPRAGKFTLSVQARGGGRSPEAFRDLLLSHFTCRLVIFGFADIKKDPRRIREYASSEFRPSFVGEAEGKAETFTLTTVLRSQDGGAMQLSQGVGIAIVLEKRTPGGAHAVGRSVPPNRWGRAPLRPPTAQRRSRGLTALGASPVGIVAATASHRGGIRPGPSAVTAAWPDRSPSRRSA